jgi:hypothetical protein
VVEKACMRARPENRLCDRHECMRIRMWCNVEEGRLELREGGRGLMLGLLIRTQGSDVAGFRWKQRVEWMRWKWGDSVCVGGM